MLLGLQNTILELIARGEPLKPALGTLCRAVEKLVPDVICSVLEIDENGIIHPIAGPSLPLHYSQALDGAKIGPSVGSCGTAAYFNRPVIVEDIETDPLWADFKELALPLGLKACWSTPISNADRVMGTFAFYFKTKRGPKAVEKDVVAACVHLCAIALERDFRIREQQRLATTDILTGLPNRARFNCIFSEKMAKSTPRIGLILADLDNLKLVNDTFGHSAGDDLIRVVAQKIAACCEPESVFRLGGDEFAILVEEKSESDLGRTAHAILEALKVPLRCNGNIIYASATLGGAHARGSRTEELLQQYADYALYHAKERSRGQYVEFVDGLGTAIMERYRAIQDVTAALAEDRIEAYYQPTVDLTTGEITGLEALCRMISADGKVVSAGEFHEATKDAHVAAMLTRKMFELVARDNRRWLDMGLGLNHVGVNVSEADFHNGNLGEGLISIFRAAGAPVDNIILEVTESVYFAQRDQTVASEIARLRKDGFRVALDDFGTGFASLSHLISVPVDIIKIDKSFVARLIPGDAGAVIVEGILSIARKLGYTVIAEGIETIEQAAQLVEFGCKLGQGYLYSKAVPFDDATRLIQSRGDLKRERLSRIA